MSELRPRQDFTLPPEVRGAALLSPIEVERLRSQVGPLPAEPQPGPAMVVLVTSIVALGLVGTTGAWVLARSDRLARISAGMEHASLGYRELVESERASLLALGQTLAEDARVRSTLSVAEIDEGTITDVLADLRKATGLPLLGVLDANGRVRAIAGADQLVRADLGSATVVKKALQTDAAASDLWTLKQLAVVVTVTPVRLASGARAQLVLGAALPTQALRRLAAGAGLDVALLVGDAPSFASGALESPVVLAAALQDDVGRSVGTLRVDVLSEGPTPIRLVWSSLGSAETSLARLLVLLSPLMVGLLGAAGVWRSPRLWSGPGLDRGRTGSRAEGGSSR